MWRVEVERVFYLLSIHLRIERRLIDVSTVVPEAASIQDLQLLPALLRYTYLLCSHTHVNRQELCGETSDDISVENPVFFTQDV